MTSKLLILIAIAAIGSAAGYGSLDTGIRAYVQSFGATDHVVFEPPGQVHNVQIDWRFTDNFQFIEGCELIFDKMVPTGSNVVCRVSGHDEDKYDGVLNPGPIIGTGIVPVAEIPGTRTVFVPVLCDDPDTTQVDLKQCDVQWIEDVKVIVVGKETTQVTINEVGHCSDNLDNDFDGFTDEEDLDCAPI